MKSFTLPVEEDPETGDHLITLPSELIEQLGWSVGESLYWTSLDDGTFLLSNKKPE